jgi:ribosomal protein S19
MLKKKFYIYTGKEQKLFTVDRQSIGLKVGEFVFTRKMGIIHKKKDKNKKGKK